MKLQNYEIADWVIKKNVPEIKFLLGGAVEVDYKIEVIDYSEKAYKLIFSLEEGQTTFFAPKSQVNFLEDESEKKDLRSNREKVIDFLKDNKIKGIKTNSKGLTLMKKIEENELVEKLASELEIKCEEVLYYDELNFGKKVNYAKFINL